MTSTSPAPPLVASIRGPFLMLPPVCVLLGAATVSYDGHALPVASLLLALLGALAAHIAVNTLNEYDDFRSGLDARTERTPFSGGSGNLPASPQRAKQVLAMGITSIAVAAAIGVWFWLEWGAGIIWLGLLGVVVIVAYTPLLTRLKWLCLIAPGLGFGTLMVVGTHFVLSGQWSATAAVASMVPFFLVSNLLLINQFPDRVADGGVGRRHLIIVLGTTAGVRSYIAFLVLTYVSIVAGVVASVLPVWSLLGLLTVPLAARVAGGLRKHAEDIPALIPFLGQNVVLTLATPVLVAVGLFLG